MDSQPRKVCEHLRPYLEQLISSGSRISGYSTAWSNCELSVTLDDGPSIALANQLFQLSEGVELWYCSDSHYSIENGLFCRACKHALAWPRREGQ
jgi:hypothetical protein